MGRNADLAAIRLRIAAVAKSDPELSRSQLARRFGVSDAQVYRALNDAGLRAGSAYDRLSHGTLKANAKKGAF
jgi:DNA invertase Pin-like site-specific DNA recombinase